MCKNHTLICAAVGGTSNVRSSGQMGAKLKKNSLSLYLQSIVIYIRKQPMMLLYVAISFISSLFPYFNTLLLNSIFANIENRVLLLLSLSMLGYVAFQIVRNSVSIICNQLLLYMSINLDNQLKEDVLTAAAYADTVFYEDEQWLKEYKRAERITSCVHDVFISTVNLISQLITLITYLTYLFRFISFYAFIGALILIPALVQSFVFSRQNYFNDRAVEIDRQRANDIKGMFLKSNILREIKLHHSASEIINKWKAKMGDVFSKKLRLEIKFSTYTSLLFVFTSIAVFTILSLVYMRLQNGVGSIGTVISLIPFMITLVSSFGQTSNNVDGIYYSIQEYRDVCSFLEQNNPAQHTSQSTLSEPVTINIENVSFKYPESNHMVLSGIHIAIEPNETVALVGKNGSGKSTLLKILAGIYAPQEGSVRYNGIEAKQLSQREIHSKVAFVFQEPIHYPFPFRRNILFGSEENEADIDDLLKQVAYSGAAESEDSILTSGYKNSVNLSGGQWQKICLARALKNKNASIFIFDEPTASLDPKAELDIFNTFLSLAKGKSVIISTHRLGLARQSDKIIVMDQGEVVGVGSHEQLIRSCDAYKNLYDAQRLWYENR